MLAELPDIPSTMDSVTQVVGNPRICGLMGDTRSHVRVMRLETVKDFSSMVDGGANICLAGMLSLLVDVVTIPPMQIFVAIEGSGDSMADCCTKRGLLLLTLDDGGVYYQPCYFCANAVETIILPQAILNGSNLFVEWSQTGYKDDSPGVLCFYSESGLACMAMVLEKRDGLYYTHTDVFPVDKNLVLHFSEGTSHRPLRTHRQVTTDTHQSQRPLTQKQNCGWFDWDCLGRTNWTCSLEM
jgi:hypothetical protein